MKFKLFQTWVVLLFVWSGPLFAVDFGQTDDSGKWESVVALTREYPLDPGTYQIFCSGVVVAPKIILTAAHCLQEDGVRPGRAGFRDIARNLKIYFGPGDKSGRVDGPVYDVERVHIHPYYLRDVRGQADVAIVQLRNNAPLAADQIYPLALDVKLLKDRLRRGSELTVVGFGFSEQLNGSFGVTELFGVKHSGPVKVRGKTADEIQAVAGDAVDRFGLYRPGPREGDSGGPAFYRDEDGSVYVAGLVSRAAQHNYGGIGSAFSIIRNWICWIERETGQNLRSAQGGPDYCSQQAVDYSRDEINRMDFFEQCQSRDSLAVSAAYTIDVLHRLFEINDCRELELLLKKTTNLNLDATHIIDLSPLASLRSLERLSVRDNAITSVRSLKNLENLRFLDISYNNVRDANSLDHLVEGGMWLIGAQRQYHNIGRTDFIRLCHDPQAPQSARKTINAIIETFGMRSNECVNANYELLRLRSLNIYRVQGLTDMTPLQGLNTLEELNLTGQTVEDLSFLEKVNDLRVLILNGNPAKELRPILAHENLRELSIENMNLKDIDILSKLPRLRLLKVKGNQIKDFSVFQERVDRGVLRIEGIDEQKK